MIAILTKETLNSTSIKIGNATHHATGLKHEGISENRYTESFFQNNKLSIVLNAAMNRNNGITGINAVLTKVVFLNERPIGKIFSDKQSRDKGANFIIELRDLSPIEVYDIGLGDRFIFFYSNGRPIGCAHHDNVKQFTIFADDEWYTQIIATFLSDELLYSEGTFAYSYVTPQNKLIEKYDGNYFSELLLSEDIETRNRYKNLIHAKEDNGKLIEKAKRDTKKQLRNLICAFIALYISIMCIVGFVDVARYNDFIETEPYHAINTDTDCSSHASQTSGFVYKRGLKVKYEKDGRIIEDTIYVSRSAYEKYKREPEFDFRILRERDSEENVTITYFVGDVSLIEFVDLTVYVLITAFFVLLNGLLVYAVIKMKKDDKKAQKTLLE